MNFAAEYQQILSPREPLCKCGHPCSWHRETPKSAQKAHNLGPMRCNTGKHLREDCNCRMYEERT